MKNIFKLLTVFSIFILTGCLGPQASWSEQFQDNFAGTAATETNDRQCFTLNKSYSYESGSTTFQIPAGRYVATQKNATGYFYKAPSVIRSSNFLAAISQTGIYLNTQGTAGNLYGPNPEGIDWNRPIRGANLPSDIYGHIINRGRC